MRFVCISDTHEKHKELILPEGDVLIHAGDFSWTGRGKPTLAFLDWFEDQPFKYKIFVSGNHDFFFEYGKNADKLNGRKIHYLMNSGMILNKQIKIWGSPFTPEFMNWAFMGNSAFLEKNWKQIPDKLDILITHGPPFEILDRTADGVNVGCPKLLEAIQIKKPKFHIFGHIHEGYGMREKGETIFINASVCDFRYDLVNEPVVFDL